MATALTGRLARVEARIVEASNAHMTRRLAAEHKLPAGELRAELHLFCLELGARCGPAPSGRQQAAVMKRRYRTEGRGGADE